jgi:hypothetical protein
VYDNKKERTDIIVDESDWHKVYTSIKLEEKWTDIIKEEAIDKRYQQSNKRWRGQISSRMKVIGK